MSFKKMSMSLVDRMETATRVSSSERFRSGEWTEIASTNEKRIGLAMVAIGGKLFVFGGSNGNTYLSSVECYDPETDQWTNLSQMPTARSFPTAAEINGSIYLCL